MYSFEDLLRFFLQASVSTLIVIISVFILSVVIKWVFYYTIVKAGAKDAINEYLGDQNIKMQAQMLDMQRQILEQQAEIQRLQGQRNDPLR